MKQLTLLALLTTTALGIAATAHADTTEEIVIQSSDLPSPIAGNANITITLTGAPPGPYTIIKINGRFNDMPIIGLVPGTVYTFNPKGNDFGLTGLVFNTWDGNMTNVISMSRLGTTGYQYTDKDNKSSGNGTDITFTSTPEPSQVISMLALAGMGGAWLLVTRRRRKQA